MELKWFFVIFGLIFTIFMLIGIYFISSNISIQLYNQFTASQNTSSERFDNTSLVHKFMFDNITDLKTSIDPITAEISNATQLRLDEEKHNKDAIIHFQEFNIMNQTLNKILQILNGTNNGTVITQVPVVINNGSPVEVKNVTN